MNTTKLQHFVIDIFVNAGPRSLALWLISKVKQLTHQPLEATFGRPPMLAVWLLVGLPLRNLCLTTA